MAARSRSAAVRATESGFDRFERFFTAPPALVVEWHDDQTPARGWVAINSLHGGAAGGGTRMRGGGTRDEAVFLAKTMQVKFHACGPAIGGGKSVIDFNPAAHVLSQPKAPEPGTAAFIREVEHTKSGVLRRWFTHIAPLLRSCYGTGGDVGVDEKADVIPITRKTISLGHPQEGIVRGHFPRFTPAQFRKSIRQLNDGVLAKVVLPDLKSPKSHSFWTIADVATGWGVMCSLRSYYRTLGQTLAGKRVMIEGFGAVGGFAAYYLHHEGAKVVGISSAGGGADQRGLRVAVDSSGLDVLGLLRARRGTALPDPAQNSSVKDSVAGDELWSVNADIFVPAALSHSINAATIDHLDRCGVRVLSCGANNPFQAVAPAQLSATDRRPPTLPEMLPHMLALQRAADERFAVIPDFIANCGMARTFYYLMRPGFSTKADAVLTDIARVIDNCTKRIVTRQNAASGLLNRGYQQFIAG